LGLLLIALAVLFAVYCARYQIQVLLANAESLKVGTLELRLREVAAQSPEIGKQIRSLGDLTDEQLQLFLIICAQREKDINYIGPQVTLPNLRKLEALGLLEGVTWEPPEPFHWHVTAQGSALHKIVMGIVTDSVSRALQCPICSKGAEQPNK
jgi:hypothetical protein